jgi:IclR family pca regulon transcriptional regulator
MPRPRVQTHRIDRDGALVPTVPILTESRFSQSLERGLAILSCCTPERPIWGIAELANELGMSRSTTHRYLSTLVKLGYMQQDRSRKYRLTLRTTELGMAAMSGTSLSEHTRPYLVELQKRTGFTVAVGVLDGLEVLLVDRLRGSRRGQHEIDLDQMPGAKLPAHCTAIGKLLLANLPDDLQREQTTEMTLTRCTPNTITAKAALRGELQSIREQSLATADEELASGLYSIAAPVRSAVRETVAAISMDAHISMIPLNELVDALGPHLISTADRISARLGYRRDDEASSINAHTQALPAGSRI